MESKKIMKKKERKHWALMDTLFTTLAVQWLGQVCTFLHHGLQQ